MNDLQDLLSLIQEQVEKRNIELETCKKRGELFNIFQVLHLERRETVTHSAFLAELLNPNGSHGMGAACLRSFIQHIPCLQKIPFDTTSANVYIEYYIGEISSDYSKGGRIDILISDGQNNSIIIENKIDANDQPKQLYRYYQFASTNYKNYCILYLTPDKECASELSTKHNNTNLIVGEQYFAIQYRKEILEWLSDCQHIAEITQNNTLNIIIKQYISIIKTITNTMEINDNVLEIMLQEENAQAILEIIKSAPQWEKQIFHSFIEKLHEALGKDVYLEEGDFSFKVWKQKSPQFVIVCDYERNEGRYIGIKSANGEPFSEKLDKTKCLPSIYKEDMGKNWSDYSINYPFGWLYLESPYWQTRKGFYQNYGPFVDSKERENFIVYLVDLINNIFIEAQEHDILI